MLIQTRIISICFKQPTINSMLINQNVLFRRIFRTSQNKIILEKIIFTHLIKKFSVLNDLECSLPCSQELATVPRSDQDEFSVHFDVRFVSGALLLQRGLIPL